jgi:hypothetical protein
MRHEEHDAPSILNETPAYPPEPGARRPRTIVYAGVMLSVIAVLLVAWVLILILE